MSPQQTQSRPLIQKKLASDIEDRAEWFYLWGMDSEQSARALLSTGVEQNIVSEIYGANVVESVREKLSSEPQ